MKRAIRVFVGDDPQRVGTLYFDAKGAKESAAFEYDSAWLAARDRFALEPGLPLVAGPQFHPKRAEGSIFHNVIADTEPDGWSRQVILRDHAKRRSEARRKGKDIETQPLSSLDFLLAVDDVSRVGALRFQDEDRVFRRAPEVGRRSTPPLVELSHLLAATRAVETNTETAADLEYLRGRGTSLGGLRPKCTVVDDRVNLSIGKLPSVKDTRAVTQAEVLVMKLAERARVNAAQAQLVKSDGIPVALIRRFDRVEGGGRVLYMSAATLLGLTGAEPEIHTYQEIVDGIRKVGAAAHDDIEELWRRIAFNILITNVDDHLRNHGFLHVERGKWRLAPAFDLNPFPDRARELKTWISEQTGPEATIEALLSAASYFRISKARTKEILLQVERAVDSWRKTGHALGMTDSELDQFADAFEHPERRAAKRILSGS